MPLAMPGRSGDSRTALKNGKTRRVFVEAKTIVKEPKQKSDEAILRTWSYYIHKVLREVHQDNTSISTKAMAIMNQLINDLFDKFAMEVSQLIRRSKRKTLLSEDIRTAVKLLIPGELCQHAIAEGEKALYKYKRSKKRE